MLELATVARSGVRTLQRRGEAIEFRTWFRLFRTWGPAPRRRREDREVVRIDPFLRA